jgi:hypothetical protein
MDTNNLQVLAAVVFALLVSSGTQPILSWVKVKYAPEIVRFPQILALQPYWGIGVGLIASLLLNTVMSRGWSTNPPSWADTWQQVLNLAGVSLAAAAVFLILGLPTYLVATRGLGLRKRDFLLATIPLLVGAPTFTIISLIFFRLMIVLVGASAVQLTPVVLGFVFALSLDVLCFEYIKRWGRRN